MSRWERIRTSGAFVTLTMYAIGVAIAAFIMLLLEAL